MKRRSSDPRFGGTGGGNFGRGQQSGVLPGLAVGNLVGSTGCGIRIVGDPPTSVEPFTPKCFIEFFFQGSSEVRATP